MKTSEEFFTQSRRLVPGGVHSPVRSFKGLPFPPRFITRGSGAYICDTEGRDYIDFCMSFGPLILGHKNEAVKRDIEEQLARGWSYGTCEPYSLELAQFIVDRLPQIEQVRFVNSGTEAVMTALRTARGYSGRNKIIKFSGCYHGHCDSMLIKAGSGLAGTSEAQSAGIPESVAEETLVLELGDANGVRELFARYPEEIAAVIIEPLPANNGLLIQEESFLQDLRRVTKENGALLIFDEVISGFRIGMGGMMGETGIVPDLVTYGKIIGGGLPVGAIAGKTEIMECLAPIGDVYQAGTLSAGPLAMAAGHSTLKQLDEAAYHTLKIASKKIISVFEHWLQNYRAGKFSNFHVVAKESLFWIAPQQHPNISRACDIPGNLAELFSPLFSLMLEKGVYLAPSPYEVGFVSLAHNETVAEELERRLWS